MVFKILPRSLEEISSYEVVIQSSSDVCFLDRAKCALKIISPEIIGGCEVRFKFCRRGVDASYDQQFEEKTLKASGKAKDFFRPPYNYCEHRAFAALKLLLEAINYLEFEDTQKLQMPQ